MAEIGLPGGGHVVWWPECCNLMVNLNMDV